MRHPTALDPMKARRPVREFTDGPVPQGLHDLFGLPSTKGIQAIMPIGHINHAKLPPVEKEQDFRQKVFQYRYECPYSFTRFGSNPA